MFVFPKDMTTEILVHSLKNRYKAAFGHSVFLEFANRMDETQIEALKIKEPFKRFYKLLSVNPQHKGEVMFLCTDLGESKFKNDRYLKEHTFIQITREEYNNIYINMYGVKL